MGENLNGDRARAAQSAAKTLRAVLRTEEPEEHAKAIHREVVDRANEVLKGHKTRPFTQAQTEVLCELISGAIHMSNLASKRPESWIVRLIRSYMQKDPMDQVKIAIAVILFAGGLAGSVSFGWYTVPAGLRGLADAWEGRPAVAVAAEAAVTSRDAAVTPDAPQAKP
ncbi:hypothetical protein [Devosia alba]|uniref:hypothetical protein n=1 Tax=Devosia alba TaxID=3152360 RepID=UPI003263D078